MGSFFSKQDAPEPTSGPVGLVRPRQSDTTAPGQRPVKRRRLEKKQRRESRAIAPPTRAMQAGIQDSRILSDSIQPRNSALDDVSKEVIAHPKRRKRKVAVFLGYIGENYYGMQMNPGVITIEQVLLTAFYRAGLISEANKDSLSKINWMRAARTDKGVSAAGQCVSAKLECEVDRVIDPIIVDTINHHLPADVQVYGLLRATAAFNARMDCHRRRYEYMFPVRLLGGPNSPQKEEQKGEGDPRVAKLTSILSRYEGTHCFASFTDGLTGSDDTSRRYMIRVRCGQPFLPPNSGVYYVTIEVYGQSFLLHQIRKMVGLALFIYLGHAPEETIPVGLCPNVKIPTPMAPALGLLLDSLTFDNYNSRHEVVLEKPISVDAFADAKDKFKLERIYRKIAERERMERTLETWVKTCHQKLQYKESEIAGLYAKFVLSDDGREEQRKAYVASLYPIRTKMDAFLDSSDEEMARLAKTISDTFQARYGTEATFLARAPGRVILIGEHLDYNGLPVIAVATTQGTIFAGCLDDTEHIEVCHLEKECYGAGQLRSNGLRMASSTDKGDTDLDSNWLQYVSWGVKALVGSLASSKRTVSGGGRLLVGGDLPRAGGLASSSSLVTGSALVAARLNRKRIPKEEIAILAAQGERVGAGTKGGAVDHIMSMCGVRGSALQISFTPHLEVAELKIPEGISLFAVDSGVTAKKGFDAYVKRQFNMRAAECRIGAALIARRLQVHLSKSVTTPGQLLFQARKTSVLKCRWMSDLRKKADEVMRKDEVASLDGIRRELDVTEIELQNRFLLGVEGTVFHVGKRMAHVFSETERVDQFGSVMSDENLDSTTKLERLGEILNDGHASLRYLFESSCAEVDRRVEFCRQNGATGSRMTGAGWGGYIINLVPSDRIAQFLNGVIEQVGDEAVVEVVPTSGACIYAIHKSYGTRGRDKKKTSARREKRTGGNTASPAPAKSG